MAYKRMTNHERGPGHKSRAIVTFRGIEGRELHLYIEGAAKKNHRDKSAQMYMMLESVMKAEQAKDKPKYEREGVE